MKMKIRSGRAARDRIRKILAPTNAEIAELLSREAEDAPYLIRELVAERRAAAQVKWKRNRAVVESNAESVN